MIKRDDGKIVELSLREEPLEEKRPDPIPPLITHAIKAYVENDLLVGTAHFKIKLSDTETINFIFNVTPAETKRQVTCQIKNELSRPFIWNSTYDAIVQKQRTSHDTASYLNFYREDMRKVITSVFGEDLA